MAFKPMRKVPRSNWKLLIHGCPVHVPTPADKPAFRISCIKTLINMDVFSDVAIFKDKLARGLPGLPDEQKLLELIDASKQVETVLLGQLRNYMADLLESLSWRYASVQVWKVVLTRAP